MRQTCRWAAASEPPGRTKDFSGSSVALTSSHASSSHVTCSGATRRRLRSPPSGTLRSAPRSKRSFCTRRSHSRVALGEALGRQREADERVELVDVAVGLDARVGLGHPAHVAQVRLAAVAQARVDARQVDRHEANVPPCSVAPPLTYARSCLLGAALPAGRLRRGPGRPPGSRHRSSSPATSGLSPCARPRSRTASTVGALLRGAAQRRALGQRRRGGRRHHGPRRRPRLGRRDAGQRAHPGRRRLVPRALPARHRRQAPARAHRVRRRPRRPPAGRSATGWPATRSPRRAAGCRPRGRRRRCACSSARGPRCASIRPPTRSSTGRAPAASTRAWRPTGGRIAVLDALRAHRAHARSRHRPRGRHQAPRRPADVGRDRHGRRRRARRPRGPSRRARSTTASRSPSATTCPSRCPPGGDRHRTRSE